MGRAVVVAAIALLGLVVPTPPATAKCGATILGLSVSGPGLSRDIELSPEQWGLGRETDLATANALFGVGIGPEPASSRRPVEISNFGPRYTLRYEVVMLDPRGRSAGHEVRIQYLFPYATGTYGAERTLAFTPRQMWETGCGTGPERMSGPWWIPFPPDAVRRLERFGLARPQLAETSTASTPGETIWPEAVALGAVGALLLGFAIRSRGRARAAPRSPSAPRPRA